MENSNYHMLPCASAAMPSSSSLPPNLMKIACFPRGLYNENPRGSSSSSEIIINTNKEKHRPAAASEAEGVSNNGGFIQLPANEAKSGKNKKAEAKIRKPRFAFQTRTQVDILEDGYRWRKYGQKAVKNNKFPRSYYRCSHQGCSVKKQIQRQSPDEGVVVTTYEGVHTHPTEKPADNFEQILSGMHIYPFQN
ncbi:probable WRKY transcription factor 45 [Diospyros lotus]|uniref:probable WRKY transcription factor 45 n=1 Tax=Diospyros lotus TaxID=55363 RepID=UPI00225BA072|nr:probable WRKY transcription factor 45 [Diospyros lotus]